MNPDGGEAMPVSWDKRRPHPTVFQGLARALQKCRLAIGGDVLIMLQPHLSSNRPGVPAIYEPW